MKTIALILSISAAVFAQAPTFRVDPSPVMTIAGIAPPLGYPQIFAVPGAAISLCSDNACANPVASYTGSTTASACPITAPVTLPGSALCQSTTGQQGQFGFWLAQGTYYYSIYLPQATAPVCCFALTVGTLLTVGTPASSSAACSPGQIEFDSSYIYTCAVANTWRRVSTSSF